MQLLGLKESKEAVYGTLDAWVAWEQRFPLASLRIAVGTLEKGQEWHRVIQVLKWILSKGQGNTMGVYRQLINALDKDNRPEEAHNFWMKKIGTDLHSVPWTLCTLMISIYYRNNMLERLVKLFKGLQSYDRKPQDKLVIQKVADAYEMLGLLEEKNRVLEKYNDLYLFTEKRRGNPKKSKKASQKKLESSVERNQTETYDEESNTKGVQMSSSIQSSTMDDARILPCTQQNKKIDLIETVHRMIRS
ncbi:Pentatricopeptide repeat-containing protein [Thalictrum thalictroides]|uniref:Pentatricopeptide repeat-containing protein n=1 Tax=Thalictrum thalictroides TaxID=46969 RepID=A0A7J6VCY3_THATH|nr:Pentatricopeptide repeat-containing protein [Thalictrum thalictroides]